MNTNATKSYRTSNYIPILALIATVAIPILIYFLQSSGNDKSLSVNLVSSVELSSVQQLTGSPDLDVYIDGKKVDTPYMFDYRVVNSGNQPIVANDFEKALTFKLRGGNIEKVYVIQNIPKSLKVGFSFDRESIEIDKFLMNPEDSYMIRIITSGLVESIEPSARIAGIRDIDRRDESKPKMNIALYMFKLLVIFGCATAYCLLSEFLTETWEYSSKSLKIILIGSTATTLFGASVITLSTVVIGDYEYSTFINLFFLALGALFGFFIARKNKMFFSKLRTVS
ncbi:hypothetical protein VINE108274_16610 [Vibrio neptunius]|uniref:hypothetical protein n=1 Tax=Vibrio neptunius TaxID=170651 RepID=UPI001C5CACE5|nr:hypothetical protein [Vibrio neptunius]QXX09266.1 hypothetical protein KW548_19645 [Vibrio neptunius]